MKYGQFIKTCRERAGKSQAEFAELLGDTPRSHISALENGSKKKPGREMLEKAAKAAGVKFEDCIVWPVGEPNDEDLMRRYGHNIRKLCAVLAKGNEASGILEAFIESLHERWVETEKSGSLPSGNGHRTPSIRQQ